MKLTKLLKDSNLENDTATIKVEIEVPRQKGYTGFDVFPDDLIMDLLVAVGRKYKIKKGQLYEKGLLPNGTRKGKI